MKKKIISLFVVLVMCICFSSVAHASYTFNVSSAGFGAGSYTLLSGETCSLTATIHVPLNSGGTMFRILPFFALNDDCIWEWDDNGGGGIAVSVDSVVGSDGLSVPYYYASNMYLVFTVPDDNTDKITITCTFTNTSDNDGPLVFHSTISADYIGVTSDMTLQDYLVALDVDLNDIKYNTEQSNDILSRIEDYLILVERSAGSSSSVLSQILSKLNWINSEMEGDAVGVLMGEYAGYNYSQLLVQIINSIKDIPASEIVNNVEVQVNLLELVDKFQGVIDAFTNINRFDMNGKMFLVPNRVWARRKVSSVIDTFDESSGTLSYPNANYPSFALHAPADVSADDNLYSDMRLVFVNENLQMLPGDYRFMLMIDSSQATLEKMYNRVDIEIGGSDGYSRIANFNFNEQEYNNRYLHSIQFDFPYDGSTNGSVFLTFNALAPAYLYDATYICMIERIDDSTSSIVDYIDIFAGTINDNALEEGMEGLEAVEDSAQTNFDEHYQAVDGAVSAVTGLTTSAEFLNTVSFISGNFTNIWDALGAFKNIVIANLLIGLALVFVGRSGKVK